MRYLNTIASTECLERAFRHAQCNKGGPGVDGITLERFAENLEANISRISRQLLDGSYRFSPALGFHREDGKRVVYTLTVADRTLAQALSETLAGRMDKYVHRACYSYRPGRSAVEAAKQLHARLSSGEFPYALRCDIQRFFDTVDHELLLRFLGWTIGEDATSTLALVSRMLEQSRLIDGALLDTRTGLCQGSSFAPALSNLYLTPLDRYLEKCGREHIRFCDDLVVLLASEREGDEAMREIDAFLREYLHLQLHPKKSRVMAFATGFDFLGFRLSPSGRFPSASAVEKLQKRLENAKEQGEREEMVRRWEAFYGKGSAASLPSTVCRAKSDEANAVSAMISLFRGNPECFARAYQGPFRYGYAPVRHPLTEEDVVEHLLGKQTLGIYLLHGDKATCSCLDIDIDKKIMDTCFHNDAGRFSVYADRSLQYARAVQKALRATGVKSLLEESGYKGYHVWIFCKRFLPAKSLISFWKQVLRDAGQAPSGIHREIFPRETNAFGRLGSLIKLPLSVHPYSGNRSMFVDETGEEITNPRSILINAPKAPAHLFLNAGQKRELPAESEIKRLLNGCTVVDYLCRKAEKTESLGHFERVILLYTIGQLAQEGADFLHETMKYTYNYNRRITQRYLEKKHPSPIGCARVQEIMGDELERMECRCVFNLPKGGYASPLLHVFADATRNLARHIPRS